MYDLYAAPLLAYSQNLQVDLKNYLKVHIKVTWFYLFMRWIVFAPADLVGVWYTVGSAGILVAATVFNYWEVRCLLYHSWFSWVLIDIQLVQLESVSDIYCTTVGSAGSLLIYSWFSWNPCSHNSLTYWKVRCFMYISWFSWVLIASDSYTAGLSGFFVLHFHSLHFTV